MLVIKETDDIKARVLTHENNIFHTALTYVTGNGEKYFHVVNSTGQDYDLEYINYNDLIPEFGKKQLTKLFGSYKLFKSSFAQC